MLDVCLLGCGGMMPLPKRFLTSLLVRHEGRSVLIDCGEATQVALHMSGFSAASIDDILITHFHGDHVGGLAGLLLTIGNHERRTPLHIWGGEGLTRIVKGLTVICGQLPFPLEIHELPYQEGSEFAIGGLVAKSQPVKHRVPCLAYRLDLLRSGLFDPVAAKSLGLPVQYWSLLQKGEAVTYDGVTYQPEQVMGPPRRGIAVTYATDCRPSEALTAFAQGSDLLVAEGLYGDDEKQANAAQKGHMIYREAAQLAKDAQVSELWLTHFSPAMINPKEDLPRAQAIFANSHVGHNLKSKTLGFRDESQQGKES